MRPKMSLDQPELLASFYEHHPDAACLTDNDGRLIRVNEAFVKLFGYERAEIRLLTIERLLKGSDSEPGGEAGRHGARSVRTLRHCDGHLIYAKTKTIPLNRDGHELGRFLVMEEIDLGRERLDGVANIHELLAIVSEGSQNVLSAYTAEGVFTYVSPSVTALLGYEPDEVVGRSSLEFNHPDDVRDYLDFRRMSMEKDMVRFTGRVRHKNGSYRWYETTVEVIRDSSGAVIQTIGVGRDVTERKEAEDTAAYLANHDALTGLANRRMFTDRLRRLLDDPAPAVHGIMLLDLDGFKQVNDSLGHEAGDALLAEAGRRLSLAVGPAGLAARWGGDEFTVLLPRLDRKAELITVKERIRQALSAPIVLEGRSLSIAASIGCAYAPEDGDGAVALLRAADQAMYREKQGRTVG